MRIRLTDPTHVAELLRVLRERGCIAYPVGDLLAIEVLRPSAFGLQEEAEVGAIVDEWLAGRPGASVELED